MVLKIIVIKFKFVARSGVGVQGALQTFFYCEVTDDMKTEQGIFYSIY